MTKIKPLIEEIKKLQKEFEDINVKAPEFKSEKGFIFGDEDLISDADVLLELDEELLNFLLKMRVVLELEKKLLVTTLETFKEALKEKETSDPMIHMIYHPESKRAFKERKLNVLYHPSIDYDKDPIPQIYNICKNKCWNSDTVVY